MHAKAGRFLKEVPEKIDLGCIVRYVVINPILGRERRAKPSLLTLREKPSEDVRKRPSVKNIILWYSGSKMGS